MNPGMPRVSCLAERRSPIALVSLRRDRARPFIPCRKIQIPMSGQAGIEGEGQTVCRNDPNRRDEARPSPRPRQRSR